MTRSLGVNGPSGRKGCAPRAERSGTIPSMAAERTVLFLLSPPLANMVGSPHLLVRRGAAPVFFQPHVGETWKRLTRPSSGGPCLLRLRGPAREPAQRPLR